MNHAIKKARRRDFCVRSLKTTPTWQYFFPFAGERGQVRFLYRSSTTPSVVMRKVAAEQVVVGLVERDRTENDRDPVGGGGTLNRVTAEVTTTWWRKKERKKKEMKRDLLLFVVLFSWLEATCFFWEEFCVCQGSLAAGGSWINSHMAYVFGGSVGLLASPCLFNDILFFFFFFKAVCFICPLARFSFFTWLPT